MYLCHMKSKSKNAQEKQTYNWFCVGAQVHCVV